MRSIKQNNKQKHKERSESEIVISNYFILWVDALSTPAFSADFVTKGDIRKSNVEMFKSFFTKEKCDQILIDTFTICYDHERKSPTAVYVEVTGLL